MSFLVPHRFCGPPESGNGGWVSGHAAALVAGPADRAVTVRLRTPPPLDRELSVTTGDDGTVTVADGDHDHAVLQARPDAPRQPRGMPEPVAFDVAQACGERYEGLHDHPFPTCFSCGTERDPADALCLRPGRVEGEESYACAWVPADDVDRETVWAALDCPGGWASGFAGRPMVLGTVTAQVTALPTPGEPHVVMAWRRGGEGRKHLSGTALYAAGGRLLAQAEAVWIAIDPTSVRPAGALT
jgi:hypothetical protein